MNSVIYEERKEKTDFSIFFLMGVMSLFLSCSEEMVPEQALQNKEEICVEDKYFIPAEERPIHWNVSVAEVIDLFNIHNQCIWESDGSTSSLQFRLVTIEEQNAVDMSGFPEFEDDVRVREREGYNTDECWVSLAFWNEIIISSEGEELLRLYYLDSLRRDSYRSSRLTYSNHAFPPSNPPSEGQRYQLFLYGIGRYNQGEIGKFFIDVFEVTGDLNELVDTAECG